MPRKMGNSKKGLICRTLEKLKSVNKLLAEGTILALNAQRLISYLGQLQIPMG